VFGNRVLRRIFEPKREEVTGEWRKLHSEELHNMYSSTHIIRQIKSTRMRWAGHVARMTEEKKVHKVLVGMPEGKKNLESQGIDGRVGSEWILGRLVEGGEWIQLAQDKDRWPTLANTLMTLRVLAPRN
jgi:hypothetical protein